MAHSSGKKIDINWNRFSHPKKRLLVTFIIQDHYSNSCYAEFHPVDKMPTTADLLYNAWCEKENYEFWGVGHLIVPAKTMLQFPELNHFFPQCSGSQTAIADKRIFYSSSLNQRLGA